MAILKTEFSNLAKYILPVSFTNQTFITVQNHSNTIKNCQYKQINDYQWFKSHKYADQDFTIKRYHHKYARMYEPGLGIFRHFGDVLTHLGEVYG